MISSETIARVRERADIVVVVGEVVPSLKLRGRSYVGLCPFHKEKSPSFHVNRDRGFFHCFGCKESGTAIDFVMRIEGATFPEAIRSLAERFGIPVEEDRGGPRTEDDAKKKQREDLFAANALAAQFYEEQLRVHPEREYAAEELERRGLRPGTSPEVDDTLQAFRIGYAPHGWDALANYFRAQGMSPIVGESAGLLVPRSSGSGHFDRFRHRLMFAVMDVQGRVVAFSGRMLKDLPGAEKKETAKYINSPESPVYVKGQHLFGLFQARHAVRKAEQAIVVEGNFDVVSLHARGVDNVVAPLGTAFTEDQANVLRRFASSVTLLFDGDAAGKKAVLASRDPLRRAGISARVATLPEGKDPDDLARERGIEAVRDVAQRARGLLEFLIEDALDETFNQADAFERASRVERIAKLIADEDDPLVRSMAKSYADRIAGRLDMLRAPEAFRSLEQRVKQALAVARERSAGPLATPERARVRARPPGSAERTAIVGALLDYPSLLRDEEVEPCLALLSGPAALVVAAIRTAAADEGGVDGPEAPSANRVAERILSALSPELPKEIRDFVVSRLTRPEIDTEDLAKGNLLDNANRLKTQLLLVEGTEIAREQERAGRDGDWDAELELARAANDRARERTASRPNKS